MTRHSIQELSPELGVQWEVVARVVFLSPVRRWSNTNGSGKVINAELVDAEGTRICACAFNNEAKNLSSMLRGGGVYRFSGGRIRKAARAYNRPAHAYEIVLSASASVTPADDDNTIEPMAFLFTSIRDLARVSAQAKVDILAIVLDVGELDNVVDRNGCVHTKRELRLADASNVQIVCTLWNEFAEVDYKDAMYQPVAFQQAMVKDFLGRSVSTLSSTMIVPSPNVPEVAELQTWFDETHGDISVPISVVDCSFTPINDLSTQPNGTIVNAIGIIVRVDEPEGVTTKDGRPLQKRTIVLQDMGDAQMECTLWQEEVDKLSPDLVGHVLVLEKAKIVIYGKCRIATSFKTLLLVDPAIPACFELAEWYKKRISTSDRASFARNLNVSPITSPLICTDSANETTDFSSAQLRTGNHSPQVPPTASSVSYVDNRLPQNTHNFSMQKDSVTPPKNLGKRGRGESEEGNRKRTKASP